MTRDELKQRVNAAIEANAERIVALGERIRRQPELGFKEVKTAALVADVFREIGLAPKTGLALTGVRAGRLELLGGKCELLRLGHLDDVDLAMMIHTTPRAEDGAVAIPRSNNGRFGKTVRFVGKAAHAGAAPHTGVNALYAAHIALMGINAVRETFRDEDTVRVHPILTHGGSQVNVIPGEARLETYVRARTLEAIREANARVDRALRAGALALGAT